MGTAVNVANGEEVAMHFVDRTSRDLKPNKQSCHCLSEGIRNKAVFCLVETTDGKQWILSQQVKEPEDGRKNTRKWRGIDDGINQTMTLIDVIQHHDCSSLRELLQEKAGNDYRVNELKNGSSTEVVGYQLLAMD